MEVGEELILRSYERSEWLDLYHFMPEPVPLVDIETSNWFTSTHPRSPFVTGLIVASHQQDGTRVSLSDWEGLRLRQQTPSREDMHAVEREQVPALLETEFGLAGFALDGDGRVVRPARPSAPPPPPA